MILLASLGFQLIYFESDMLMLSKLFQELYVKMRNLSYFMIGILELDIMYVNIYIMVLLLEKNGKSRIISYPALLKDI